MKKSISMLIAGLFTLGIASVAFAKWIPVHQIASEKMLYIGDGETGKSYRASFGDASSNWQETTKQAFSHAVALASGGGLYEFRLVYVQNSDSDLIQGLWDVYRDGSLVCDNCVGKAYGLSGAVGNYFKIYVGTPIAYSEAWHISGYITHRFDY